MSQFNLRLLILKTAFGDREAYEQLMLSQKNNIYYTIRKLIDCPEDIEDISQEVAIRVFQYIGSLKNPEAFCSWLRTLVLRESMRLLSARTQTEPFDPDNDWNVRFVETDPACLPTTYTELLELSASIRNALCSMPKMLREVLILYYLGGMRYREIADFLGTTIGAVSAYLSRARNRLRKELELQ